MSASVSMAAVQQAEKLCIAVISELNSSLKKLNTRYQEAGRQWKDDKYKQLGVIIESCTKSMKMPVDELSDCIAKLKEIEKTFADYENTNIK